MNDFEKAYLEAKKAGEDTFYWNGNWYKVKDTENSYANSYATIEDGVVTITAPRTKINNNTEGVIHISRPDIQDRLWQDYQTKVYYIVDKYGNIIGDTLDPRAEQEGFFAFNNYTGSKEDLRRIGAAELVQQANLAEANQLARQAYERQLLGEGMIADINNGRAAAANTIQQIINMPNHAVMGLPRVLISDTYSFNDYLDGLDINHAYQPLNQTQGIGDIFEVQSPAARFILNSLGNTYTIGSSALTARLPSGRFHTVEGQPMSIPVFRTTAGGRYQIATSVPYRTSSGGTFRKGPVTRPFGGTSVTPVTVNNNFSGNTSAYVTRMPTTTLTYEAIPGNYTPTFYTSFTQPLSQRVGNQYVPTANFYYPEFSTGANQTVIGRMQTGDFVPGTTFADWGRNVGGGKSIIVNTDGITYPQLTGTVVAPATNFKSDIYLAD